MKKPSWLYLILLTLCFTAPACHNSSLPKLAKKYHCSIEGEGEPRSSEEYVNRGLKHINEQESIDCGFDACAEAVRLNDKNALAYGCRGFAQSRRGQWDAALKDFDQAIRLDPENVIFYTNRSRVLREKGLYDKALPDIDFVIKNSSKDSPVLHYDYATRGRIYANLGDYESALKDYSKAIRLKPNYYHHYTERAEIYRKANENDLAFADEERAADLELLEKSRAANENSASDDIETIPSCILNRMAIEMPKPVYPPSAKVLKAGGGVTVSIEIDEKGFVTSVRAISGHPLLRPAAENAARKARFNSMMINGKPAKITGVLTYDFISA